MAKIQAFKAWRYNPYLSQGLKDLTGPLSETIFQQKQAALYQSPYHHYHLSSPLDVPPFKNAKRRVENWILDQVLWEDALPGIYVYAQDYNLDGVQGQRLGFMAHLEVEEYSNKLIFPHERTIPRAVEYRSQLLEATQMHSLATHGMYYEPEQSIESHLKESLGNPIYAVQDNEGTLHRLSVIHDQQIIQKIQDLMQNQKVWIADGHHRYESSLRYRYRKEAQLRPGEEALDFTWKYHLMWFTNRASSDEGIFPTHRLIHSLGDFDAQLFLKDLEDFFYVQAEQVSENWNQRRDLEIWSYGLIMNEKEYLLQLRPEVFELFNRDFPPEVKRLEVSVLHHFILERILGLKGNAQFEHLDFHHDLESALEEMKNPRNQCLILTRAISAEEIENICFKGYTLPVKSTYFFPKVLGGLLFSAVDEYRDL